MKASEVYSKNYLSVERWPEEPTEHVITDVGVDDDSFAKGNDARVIVIRFDNDTIMYRVNRTNSEELARAFGDDLSKWKGKRVHLFKVQGTVRGRKTWLGKIVPIMGKKGKAKKVTG